MHATVEPTEILVDRLLQQPIRRAELLVRNDRRFQRPEVVDGLLGETRRVLTEDPGLAQRIANLARIGAEQLDEGEWGRRSVERCRVLALAEVANAHRCCGDLTEADRRFSTALRRLEATGPDGARVLALLGSLRIDQRRPAEARTAIHSASAIYGESSDDVGLAETSCTLTCLCIDEGVTPNDAELPLREAVAIVDPAEDPRLAYCVRHNLCWCYIYTGRPEAARRLFDANRPLFQRHRERLPFAIRLEGAISMGVGDHDRAEQLLRRAWREFQRRSRPHDWGLVLSALELATLYAESGRRSELKRFAREMASILFWPGVHREAVAALGRLLRAIELDAVGAETIRAVRSYVQRSRFRPGLAFELI